MSFNREDHIVKAIFLIWTLLTTTNAMSQHCAATLDLTTLRPSGGVFDLYLYQNKLAIADLSNNQVIILDRNLMLVKTIQVKSPHAAVFDSKGFLYVATARYNRILKFNSQYQEVEGWDKSLRDQKALNMPVALDVGESDSIYVTNWEPEGIIHVDAKGKLLHTFSSTGTVKIRPHGISFSSKHQRVFVADRVYEGGAGTIHVFSTEGIYLSSWSKPKAEFDPLNIRPISDDLWFVPDYFDGKIYIFDISGRVIEKLELAGVEPGRFQRATSVAIDNEGFAYITELNGNRVQKIDFKPVLQKSEQALQSLQK